MPPQIDLDRAGFNCALSNTPQKPSDISAEDNPLQQEGFAVW